MSEAEISRDWLSHPCNNIPVEDFQRLVKQIQDHSGEHNLGLMHGKILAASNINLRIHLQKISRTVNDYINFFPSLLKLIGDVGDFTKIKKERSVGIQWDPLDQHDDYLRYMADMALAGAVHHMESISIVPIVVRSCRLTYSRPKDTSMLYKVFGEEILFDQSENVICFDNEILNYPVFTLNEELLQGEPVARFYESEDDADPFMRELYESLIRLLPSGKYKIDDVAKQMGTSGRTLQRRIKDRNSSFHNVLQTAREWQAKRYLVDTQLSITEIAFLLGYSNSTTFSTAFKTWFEVTPSDYRDSAGASDEGRCLAKIA